MNEQWPLDAPESVASRLRSKWGAVLALISLGLTAAAIAQSARSAEDTLRVRGRVAGGVAGITISVLPFSNLDEGLQIRPVARTDPDGQFAFDTSAPREPFVIVAIGRELVSLRGPFRHVDQVPRPLVLSSRRLRVYETTLVDATDGPLVGARVSVRSIGRVVIPFSLRAPVTAETGPSGGVVLPFLDGARLTIGVEMENEPTWVLWGSPTSPALRLPESRRFEGMAVDSIGRPLEGTAVEMGGFASGGQWRDRSVTDAQGRFVLAAPTDPGVQAQVTLRHPGRATSSRRIPLDRPPARFVLEDASRLRVILPDEGDALVRLRNADGDTVETVGKNGEAVFEDRESGVYNVEVHSRLSGRLTVSDVQLAEGETRELAIETPRLTEISGRVVDASRRPVPAVRVRVVDTDILYPTPGEWLPTQSTSEDGRFAFTSLYQRTPTLEFYRSDTGWTRVAGVASEEASEDDLEVVLNESGSISGSVTPYPDPDGLIVALLAPNHTDRVLLSDVESGSYRFIGVPAANYGLQLLTVSGESRRVTVSGEPTVAELGSRASGGWIRGQLRRGKVPVVGAAMHLVPTAAGRRLMKTALRTITGDEGDFAMFVDSPGRYLVHVEQGSTVMGAPEVELTELRLATDLRFASEDLVEIDLADTRVFGTAVDQTSGVPLDDASFDIRGDGETGTRWAIGRTDESGNFDVRGLSPGLYKVSFGARHFLHSPRENHLLAEGEPMELLVPLERGYVIRAFVKSEAGRPVAGAQVRVINENGIEVAAGRTTEDGWFSAEIRERPERCEVRARAGDSIGVARMTEPNQFGVHVQLRDREELAVPRNRP